MVNLFTSVTYENLKQEAAAGGGTVRECFSFAVWHFPDKQTEFGQILQWNHADLFSANSDEERTLHLVSTLNRELATASLLP